MEMGELRTKSPEELKDLNRSLKKELFNLRFQQATGELTNTGRFRQVRQTIARVNTVLKDPQQLAVKDQTPKAKKAPKAKAEPKAKAKAKK